MMPSSPPFQNQPPRITKFTNCLLVKDQELISEDLWIDASTGRILNSQSAFYSNHVIPDEIIDLDGKILAPGFIDVQINGAGGFNFSEPGASGEEYRTGLMKARKQLVREGVTSFLPTVTSQPADVYKKVLPYLGPSVGDGEGEGDGLEERDPANGAESLGAHVEGPFISERKHGMHPVEVLQVAHSLKDVEDVYGTENLYPRPTTSSRAADENAPGQQQQQEQQPTIQPPRIKKITAAPELGAMADLIPELTTHGRIFSIGHTAANYSQAMHAVSQGATMITHLFNAMLPFGHRDPGIFGLLGNHSEPVTSPSASASPSSTSSPSPSRSTSASTTPRTSMSSTTSPFPAAASTAPTNADNKPFRPFFGLISDSIHLHPTTLALAHSSHPSGTILVTDSHYLTGLPNGTYPYPPAHWLHKADLTITLEPQGTLAGSAVRLIDCVNNFRRWTGVSVAVAVRAVTETPARMLGRAVERRKGRLDDGMDADLVVLSDAGVEAGLTVEAVWKWGTRVA